MVKWAQEERIGETGIVIKQGKNEAKARIHFWAFLTILRIFIDFIEIYAFLGYFL